MAPCLSEDLTDDKSPEPERGDEKVNLKIEWKSEYACYDLQPQSIYVNANLKAPECPEEIRKPIDVVVVLDRSGSMSGEKLALCLKTIKFLVQEMAAHDRLSVVSYDTEVRTDLHLTKMNQNGKQAVDRALPQIKAGRATNLSGGLLQGMQEIQRNQRDDGDPPNPVKSVLLLTDGLANHGIQSTKGMVQMLEGALHKDVSLFTFGYGSDHNADMLRQISDVGRGVYYFVKDVDGVSLAFADCLGGLLSVAAQNIKLNCLALDRAEIVSVKTKNKVKTIKDRVELEIEVGDLYGEEERDILFEVNLPDAREEDKVKFGIINCTLTYANIVASTFIEAKSELNVERLEQLNDRAPDSHVVSQKNRILTAEALEKATEHANAGDMRAGSKVLENTTEQITATLELMSVNEIAHTECLIQDLRACRSDMANERVYASGGRFRSQAKAQSHFMQRSNAIDDVALAVPVSIPSRSPAPRRISRSTRSPAIALNTVSSGSLPSNHSGRTRASDGMFARKSSASVAAPAHAPSQYRTGRKSSTLRRALAFNRQS